MRDYVKRGSDYFLAHHMYRSSHNPSTLLHKHIDELTFPNFVYSDFLEIFDTLLSLGIKNERMRNALDLLQSKRRESGRWILEREVQTCTRGWRRRVWRANG